MTAARLLLALALLAAAPPAAAGDDIAAICSKAAETPRPAARSAGPAPKDCDALALYDGVGGKPDYRAARACALAAGAEDYGGLDSRAVLTMIYANGLGVPRDDDLAIAYACDAGGAPAEISGRIANLVERKAKASAVKDRFDFCNDITSGLMEGACAARDSQVVGAKREAALARLTKRLSPSGKKAFVALRKAFDDYSSAVGDNEVDLSGTARGAMIIEAKEEEAKTFVTTLKSVLSAAGPGPGADLKTADGTLNDLYKKVQASEKTAMWGTVTKDGVKTAQRAWLLYRNRFLAFAEAAGSKMSTDTLYGRLTRQRIENLEAFADQSE